jgi:DNA-directed RNA polymerase specialized sigma24 family protein
MATPAPKPIPDHPLLSDRRRLDAITDVMYAQIQKVMFRYGPRQRRSAAQAGRGTERSLHGGSSADDVLQEATLALLCYPPDQLATTWEALAVRIAQNKAVDAVRAARKGRARSSEDDEGEIQLIVLDLDARAEGPLGTFPTPDDELEREFIKTRQQKILERLAREVLSERDRRIYYDVHHLGISNAEAGRALGLTGQGVGQIYRAVANRLLLAAHNDPEFRLLSDHTNHGEQNHDDPT